MSARDDAIKAMSDYECGPQVPADVRRFHEIRVGDMLDNIPTRVLARLVKERRSERQRVICHECGRWTLVRVDGRMWRHSNPNDPWGADCAGSRQVVSGVRS